jgi:hypothetical protein
MRGTWVVLSITTVRRAATLILLFGLTCNSALRSTLIRNAQIALIAATILAPSISSAQWLPYGPADPYGYGGYGGYGVYGYYGNPHTRYSVPSDQMHWYSRSPVDFNT